MIVHDTKWSVTYQKGYRCAVCGLNGPCYRDHCGEEEGIKNLPGRYLIHIPRAASPEEVREHEAREAQKKLKELQVRLKVKRPLIEKIIEMVDGAKSLPPHVRLAILKTTSDAIRDGTTMWKSL